MRPEELSLRGFTCFREATTVSFRGIDVFAIAGPMGSGKTSLLDGMIFALYGRVPRMGKQCSELISIGRDALAATLAFRVGERHFVVTRKLRRKGATVAQLDEGSVTLANGVQKVDEQIEKLLGMNYDTFVQAVVLPQGEFASFLRSKQAERTKILSRLLRLSLYESMRTVAREREKALVLSVASIDQQLDKNFKEATPEAEAALEGELAACRQENEARASALATHASEVSFAKALLEKTNTLTGALAARAKLAGDEARVAAVRVELGRAERALPIEAYLRELASAKQTEAARARELAEADVRAREARGAAEARAEERAKAEREAEGIEAARARIEALDGVVTIATDLASERLVLAEAARDLASAGSQVAVALAAKTGALDAHERSKKRLEEAEANVAASGYDARQSERLDAAQHAVQKLAAQRRAALDAARAKADAQAIADEKTLASAHAREDEDAAKAVLEAETVRLAEAKLARDEAMRTQHALALHDVLAVGQPCPVCEREVTAMPERPQATAVAEIEARFDRASLAQRAAADAAATTRARAEAAAQALREAKAQHDDAEARRDAAARELARAEAQVGEQVSALLTGEAGDTIEARFEARLRAVRASRSAFDKAVKAREAKAAEVAAAGHAVTQRDHAHRDAEARREAIAQAIAASGKRIEAWEARVFAVTRHPDPRAERKALAASIEALDRARGLARDAEQKARSASDTAHALFGQASRLITEIQSAGREAERLALEACQAEGFSGVGDASAAQRSAPARESLRAGIDAFDKQRHAVDERIALLERELGGQRVTFAHVREAEASQKVLENQHRDGVRREGELTSARKALAEHRARAAELGAERETMAAKRQVYVTLAKDLGTTELQQFVQKETLDELVARASERLERLSGRRYGLVVMDEEFFVIDHDNADARRHAATLSGGETFLTSLALALELTEQVQRAAGAVRLESLFVDEGFGTLDPEALDVAAEAIESLQVGGRMVGVVTHVPALTERLPARILLRKGPDGAVVTLDS